MRVTAAIPLRRWYLLLTGLCLAPALLAQVDTGPTMVRDHYIPVRSTAPSMAGEVAQLYVRERILPQTDTRDLPSKVVLFIHGAGTPAEVAFDPATNGYSWMDYLARRGYDTFSMDMTGYGRSTRPHAMNDRCNLAEADQTQLFGNACDAGTDQALTTMASDWNDIDAVVDWLRALRNVNTIHLVAWSQGGPRAAGYAAQHPDKVGNMVLLAPLYNRATPEQPEPALLTGTVLTKQSESDFFLGWDRQVGCLDQYEPDVAYAVWRDLIASDPIGATWGSGVRRAPRVPTFGWTPAVVASTTIPTMMVAGLQDKQVLPERVAQLYEDLGAERKVYLTMACSSHNAMWERDAELLFNASYQWLSGSAYNGMTSGQFELTTP